MKPTELMIGDWVSYLDTFNESNIGRVTHLVNDELHFEIAVDNCFHDSRLHSMDGVQSLPLTIEILEKNGFELQKNNWYRYHVENKFELVVRLPQTYDEVTRFDFTSLSIPEETETEYSFLVIKGNANIHQLQHFMRLCGLSELADNLKI